MFIHDCTIYRQEDGVWNRYELRGVFWHDVAAENLAKSGYKEANTLELLIPHSLGFKAKKRDMVLKGIVDYEIKSKPSELYDIGDVRIVTTVDCYDFGGDMAHDKVGGR